MAYTVLARRYRSGTFDEVVGQAHVAQTLKKAIASGRVAHAFLFCGTRGVGKTSMARILAKALNCEKSDGPTTTPCGKCESCTAIARGYDIDVIEIDAASNTGVDNARDIIENSRFSPARSRFKIYIIDEVHMLSRQAFNALLKTLEEPPAHVKFILATTEPEKILPTILSRCQRYDFRNIPTREIAEHLKAVVKGEKVSADEDVLLLIAKAGAGSMRDSLSLLDRLLSVGEKKLTIEIIEELLGMPRSQVIFDLAGTIGEGDVKAALISTDKVIRDGLSPDTLVGALTDHLRDLLIVRTCGANSGLVETPGLTIEQLTEQASRFDAVVLSQDIAVLEELRRQLRTSSAGRALLDATIVRLTLAEQFTPIQQLLDGQPGNATAPALKKKVAEAKLPPVVATPDFDELSRVASRREPVVPATQASPLQETGAASDDDDNLPQPGRVWDNSGPSLSELVKAQESLSEPAATAQDNGNGNVEPASLDDLGGLYQRLLAELGRKDPALPPLLNGAKLVGIEDRHVILRYPKDHEHIVRRLEVNGKKDALRDMLTSLVGQSVGVKFELDASEVESPRPAPIVPRPRKAIPASASAPAPVVQKITPETKEELRKEPLVETFIKQFNAEIVRVE